MIGKESKSHENTVTQVTIASNGPLMCHVSASNDVTGRSTPCFIISNQLNNSLSLDNVGHISFRTNISSFVLKYYHIFISVVYGDLM